MPVEVFAYTDGACSGNPGPGGWGVSLQAFQNGRIVKQSDFSGACEDTTNNRMELQAAIEALKALRRPSDITIVTDSKYLRDGITKWLRVWEKNGWKTVKEKDVKNKELWQELGRVASIHRVKWDWTKGHADNSGNKRADELARHAIERLKRLKETKIRSR
ncbi:MAG: ribonuclease HI [Albidovulum sp.]|nr:ribonuclease HI [Albidovulum sp.]MDE0307199.1 ribonuclease HI [Albidovulum sp.]MDE0531927.1 ribonuclease HI [Albidovulum sp.]